jgi:hexosaminidase
MQQTVIGWDEVVHAGLAPGKTIVCWWRQEKPEQLAAALQQQYRVILCPRLPFYFDFVQDSTDKKGRKWNKQYNSLEQVYNFSQDHLPVTIANSKQVLGIQANLWTETVKTKKRLDYMLFPRLCALAEAAWTTTQKDYKGFEERLRRQFALFERAGIYYYDPKNPRLTPEPQQ